MPGVSKEQSAWAKEWDLFSYLERFVPGEVSPEEANRIGYELAMRFTKGKHPFFVATHTDKAHIHNHIEFNSTNLERFASLC